MIIFISSQLGIRGTKRISMNIDNERAIRAVVRSYVEAYATGFSDRHLSEVDDPDGTINMKINNVFIAALGADIQYYSALARSLDSSLGNMLEKMAIQIFKDIHILVKSCIHIILRLS